MRPAVDFATIALEAATGSNRLFIAICPDAASTEVGADSVGSEWRFRTAKQPVVLRFDTATELLAEVSRLGEVGRDNLFLAPYAWRGDTDDTVVARWAQLNSRRDAIRTILIELNAVMVLFVPEQLFRRIAGSQVAVDLLGLAQVETADDESPAIDGRDPGDAGQIEQQRALLLEFETLYGLSSGEFLTQVMHRQPSIVPIADQKRWTAAISLLRKVEP